MDGVFMFQLWKKFGFLILAAAIVWCAGIVRDRVDLGNRLIRLHVVANSDSRDDQAVKLQVRDAVIRYLQDTLSDFLGKRMGVVLAAFLFGAWHLINGFFMQMVFTFGIGLVFGFARSKVRDCSYLSVALGHGLYDFLNVIVTMFIL